MERGVEAVLTDEIVVAPSLGDPAVVQDENLIRFADGRNPVRHDDRRPLAHDATEACQDFFFRIRVHRGQRIVQDQDGRVGHQRAGECRALFLAARERDPALSHHGVVAAGKLLDVLVEARDGGGRPDRIDRTAGLRR